jgi:hypothetical protein
LVWELFNPSERASGYSISKSKAFCCESGSLSWKRWR